MHTSARVAARRRLWRTERSGSEAGADRLEAGLDGHAVLRWCEWEEFLQQAADAAADQNRAKADADDFVQGDAEIVLPGRELQYQARCAVGAVYVFDGKVTAG